MKGLFELGVSFDGKLDGGSEKEEGERCGRFGNLGIFIEGRIIWDPGRAFLIFCKRGFSITVESEGEKRER